LANEAINENKSFHVVFKRGVILTKITWLGEIGLETNIAVSAISQKQSTISYFDCFYVKFLWRSIHILFGLTPPSNIDDLFHNWSKLRKKV
jgi:hypothetical protein